jgi:hypothetical protein
MGDVTPAPGPGSVIVHQPSGNPVVVATGIIDALRAQPLLLVIVILNVVMIAGAAFYLLRVEEYRHQEKLEMFKLIDKFGLGGGAVRPVRPSLVDRHRMPPSLRAAGRP